MKPTTLQTMLSETLDSRFLRELGRRLPTIYREAESRSLKDKDVHEALKPYCFWQNRYILAQSMFMKLSSEMSYDAQIYTCETNGFPIPTVKKGRFLFTLHHSSRADENAVLGSSLIRQQCSAINFSLIQPGLFDQFDETELLNAENIYCNLIFGTFPGTTDFVKYGFLQAAVPFVKAVENKNGKMIDRLFYAEKSDLNVILGLVIQREATIRKSQPTLKAVEPTIKNKRAE